MRVILLCHAATGATRSAAFPTDADEPEPAGIQAAIELAPSMPRADRILRANSRRCVRTTIALGLSAEPDPGLDGCDFGAWTGRTLDEVLAEDPEAVTSWLTNPAACPHGGESLAALLVRIGSWLDGLGQRGSVLAVADSTVIRAALSYAVTGQPQSIWRFDVAPLSRAVLVGEPGRWSLRALGKVLATPRNADAVANRTVRK